MKELSIEEKAKAYDNALKVLHRYDGANIMFTQDLKEEMFPELKESEDEKIRKELIKFVKVNIPDEERYITWLEKQGQKPDNKVGHLIPQKGVYYVCIKDYYLADGKITNTEGKIYKSPCDGYINDDKGFGLSWINSCTENFFRPVKEEDWIVCEQNNVIGKPLQCKEFISKLIQKNIKSLEDKGIVPNFRLWDISDAKDGDVLVYRDGQWIFIYKEKIDDNSFSYYALHSTIHQDLTINDAGFTLVGSAITPATKEQRDTLMKAMADAGYTFDFEKKELKKVEQKFAWSEEDENRFKNLIMLVNCSKENEPTKKGFINFINRLKSIRPQPKQELKKIVVPTFNIGDTIAKKHNSDIHNFGSFTITDITGGKYWYNDRIICNITKQDEWELVEQKPAWSKEDEDYLKAAIWYAENPAPKVVKNAMLVEWLKNLRGRVQPQPKQEWSEEDEIRIKNILSVLDVQVCWDGATGKKGNPYQKEINWLKSLRPKNTWKPSDEQLKSLREVIDAGCFTSCPNSLETLYEQLKRL